MALTKNAKKQRKSPLFRLPLELRCMIYRCTFTEEQVPQSSYFSGIDDRHFKDEPDGILDGDTGVTIACNSLPNWLRPGNTARVRIHSELLQTCKLVYAEANDILSQTTKHRCYQGYGPAGSPSYYFQSLSSSQLAKIRRLHIFTQVVDFDRNGMWLRNELRPVSPSLRHLTITLRHLGGSPDKPLLINPFRRGAATQEHMSRAMKHDPRSKSVKMPKTGWGGTFAQLPALETLTIEMEDEEARKNQLEEIAAWATTWVFLLGNGRTLTCKAAPVTATWKRPQTCHHKHNHGYDAPRIITKSIRWKSSCDESLRDQRVPNETPLPQSSKPTGVQARLKNKDDSTRIDRPAYDPCLGGLNSIYASASDDVLRNMIAWGVL